jgi:hypothetical protein
MRIVGFAIAIGLSCVVAPALAQDQTTDATSAPARYTFNRVEDGFLRLDNVSGQVTICSQHSVGWACQAVPEDRTALEGEIARLQNEVAGLKTEIAALREPPPPPPRHDDAVQLREDMQRARVAIENAWRRIVETIVNFQKDMLHKG